LRRIEAAIDAGMWRGELLSLIREHVHLEKRYVHLLDTKHGDSEVKPLSPVALELLEELPRNIRGDQVVFSFHREALQSSWGRACSRAAIIIVLNVKLRIHKIGAI
jgi:integrase